MWRVWIEMYLSTHPSTNSPSPSVWRVWIEITQTGLVAREETQSPSVWRVWIEIAPRAERCPLLDVTLRVEGVD